MLDERIIRKLLMTAVVVAVATTPVAAEANDCELKPMHYGLSCNNGEDIELCRFSDDECTVDCGNGAVDAAC